MGRKRSRSASSSGRSSDSRTSDRYNSKRSRSTSRARRRERRETSREPRHPAHRSYDSPRRRERSRTPLGHRHARTAYRDDSRRGDYRHEERSPDPRHRRDLQRSQITVEDGPPQLFSIHRYSCLPRFTTVGAARCSVNHHCAYRAKVQSIRPFGIFVALHGYRRHGMVHCSQVSEELSLSRDDEDDTKVKAMEFFCPPASEVRHCLILCVLHLLLAQRSCYFSLWQVWVKVSEIREEGGGAFKVACSMKVCYVFCISWSYRWQLHMYKQELARIRCVHYCDMAHSEPRSFRLLL